MKVREPTRSAGKGWHVVTIVQQTREILSIHKIIEVTDFGSRTGKPIADGNTLL